MELTKLRIAFDGILGYTNPDLNNHLWSWVKEHSAKIAELEAQTDVGGQAEVQVSQVTCGHCKDCKFWNDKNGECANDIIWLNADLQTKKQRRSKIFYNISDLKTNLEFGCIRFESKLSS